MSGIYDTVQNPIPKTGFFATPESYQELIDYLDRFNGAEKALAMTIACMSLNLAHKLVEEEILNKEVFGQ
jgi:hypothetical protein